MRTIIVLLVLVGIIAGGAAYIYVNYYAVETPKVYRTVKVERGDLTSTISATGTLQAEDLHDVGAQVTGKIMCFGPDPDRPGKTVDFRTKVRKNMLLAKIDPVYFKAQWDQANAALLKAEADVLQLKATCVQREQELKRAKELRPQKAISDTDYDTDVANYEVAKANVKVGEAAVKQAEAALVMAQTNLDYTTIVSPVDGEVIARRVNVGQTVTSGFNTPSIVLIAKDLKRLQIWALVNEADIGRIHLDMPVRFTVATFPDESFRGVVTQIRLNAAMTSNIVSYTVVVTVDNSNLKLFPYMTASVYFEVEHRKDIFKVPNAALRWKPSAASPIASSGSDSPSTSEQEGGKSAAAGNEASDSVSRKKATDAAGASGGKKDRHRLWVWDGNCVQPLNVIVGITDDMMTEIRGKDVKEGLKIVVGEAQKGEADKSDDGTTNPFLPKMRRSQRPPPPPG
jgi:HlyD family secretion protein